MLSIIGKVIRQLREEKNISVEELSQRTGITPEKLNEIENIRAYPSLGMLIKVSRALGSRLGTILDGQEKVGATITRREDITKCLTLSDADSENQHHLKRFTLARDRNDRHMEPLVIEVASTLGVPVHKSGHEGEEFFFVIEGSVTLYYGTEVHKLNLGDSIYYDSIVPHFLANESTEPASIVVISYTPY